MRISLAVTLALLLAGRSAAQPKALDLIPDIATIVIATPNFTTFEKKGTTFLDKMDVPNRGQFRISMIVAFVLNYVGGEKLSPLIQLDGQCGAMACLPETAENRFNNLLENLLVYFPVNDLKALKALALKEPAQWPTGPNEIVPFGDTRAFVLRDKIVYVASTTVLQRFVKAGPIASLFAESERKALNESDIIVHFDLSSERLRKDLGIDNDNFFRKFALDSEEDKMVLKLVHLARHIRFATGGARLEDGLGMHMTFGFDAKVKEVAGTLESLREGTKASTIAGLPEGRLLLAQAQGGQGSKSGVLARGVMQGLVREILNFQPDLIDAGRKPIILESFTEIWHHLVGSRLGLYLNDDEFRQGLFHAVAILDTENGAAFLAEMKKLARLGQILDPDVPLKLPDEKEIAQWLRDLGDPSYRVREAATLRLRLLEEASLGPLAKLVDKADNLEVRRRAERLHSQISEVIAARRKNVVGSPQVKLTTPSMIYVPAAEKVAGFDVDVVQVKLNEQDKVHAKTLTHYLGPQWSKIRLASVDRQVVAFFGSDVSALEKTLKGLSARPRHPDPIDLKAFRRLEGEPSRVEVHISAEGFVKMMKGELPPRTLSHSSLGVSIGADRVHVDVMVPFAEGKRVFQAGF